MKRSKAKEMGYTHLGLAYENIPIYLAHLDDGGIDIKGRNLFWDCILWAAMQLDMIFGISEDYFRIWEGEEL